MIGIVGHIDRIAMVEELAGKVGAEYVSIDDGTIGARANHLRVWSKLATLTGHGQSDHDSHRGDRDRGVGDSVLRVPVDPGGHRTLAGVDPHRTDRDRGPSRGGIHQQGDRRTQVAWCVVLEDDAIPCGAFRRQLNQVLTVATTPIVGLYLGRSYPIAWQRHIAHIANDPAHWAISTHLLHGVGTAIRADLVPDMITHVGRQDPEWPIDDSITAWARARGHLVGYTRPSLVDHADQEPIIQQRYDGGQRDQPRTAWAFGTREHWNNSKVTLP